MGGPDAGMWGQKHIVKMLDAIRAQGAGMAEKGRQWLVET